MKGKPLEHNWHTISTYNVSMFLDGETFSSEWMCIVKEGKYFISGNTQ